MPPNAYISPMIARLFDIVSQRAATGPDEVMLAGKEGGAWRTYSAKEVWNTAQDFAAGLQTLGLQPASGTAEETEKIALISPNRPEWLITDCAVQLSGAVLTPLYPTIAPADLTFVLKQAGVRIVILADKALYRRFRTAIEDAGTVKTVISYDAVDGLQRWTDLLGSGTSPDPARTAAVKPVSLATIIYTSGTTGEPKGVMLTQRNLCSNVEDCMPVFTFAKPGERALSFLPLNHIFERTISYIYLNAGLQIWYAEGMEKIGDNLRELKPMVFVTVPRLLEKVYERIVTAGLGLKGAKRALFWWAMGLAKQYDNVAKGSVVYRAQLALANKLVFSKWRAALGGNVKAVVTGGAALQQRLARVFSAAGIVVMEGYGLTETSPVVSVNRFESDGRRIGSIGPLIDNVEAKLADDGEILCRGQNVMAGYYGRPDLTAEAIDADGWFHTGDVGTWVDGRFLKITDRKKEIFKNSGGKYIAPQPIENAMRESPYIEQIMVVGAGRKTVTALIVPAFPAVEKWLRDGGQNVPDGAAAVAALPVVRDLIRKQLDKYNPRFAQVEQVKKFALLSDAWSIDGGELTPKLSMRRKVIEDRHSAEIDALYAGTEVE